MNIAEVCRKYELTQDTLRYYERIGLIPPVHRTPSGIRDFTDEDCRWVEFIKCMRASGLTIEVLSEYVRMFLEGDSTLDQRKALIVEQRDLLLAQMMQMQITIDRLNRKIERYGKLVVGAENELRHPDKKLDRDQLLG